MLFHSWHQVFMMQTHLPSPPNRQDEPQRGPLTPTLPPYSRQLPHFLPLGGTPITLWFDFQGHHHQFRPAVSPCRPPESPRSSLLSFQPKGPKEPLRSNHRKAPKGGLTWAVTPAPGPP